MILLSLHHDGIVRAVKDETHSITAYSDSIYNGPVFIGMCTIFHNLQRPSESMRVPFSSETHAKNAKTLSPRYASILSTKLDDDAV